MGRTLHVVLVGLFVLFLPWQTAALAQTSLHLSDSMQRVVFDSTPFFGNATRPQWSNGYLVSKQTETFQQGVPNVWLYDKSGTQIQRAAIWFPESQRVLVYSAMAAPDGRVLVSGKAEKADGEAEPFIALTDGKGSLARVIRTKGFAPANVCLAPNGTVWSFGGTGYDEHSQPNPGNTLRNFDFEKGELSSYLPQSTFPQKLHPGPAVGAFMHCSTNELVVYSPSARQYIVFRYGNAAPHVYQARNIPSNLRISGFAALDSKRVYGQFSHGDHGGLFVLSFDEANSSVAWHSVTGTVGKFTSAGVVTALWGADGDKLLVGRAEDPVGERAIHWTSPLEQ